MALSAATLKAGFEALEPTNAVAEATARLATAFDDYFVQSQAGPIAVAPGSTAGAKSAMQSALSGVNAPNAAATVLAAAISTYWSTAAAAAATIWVAVPPAVSATPPPGLSGLQAAIEGAFAANLASEASLSDAAETLANAIHATQSGGICVFPPPSSGGIGPQPIT
jgi:hypothetical protein